MKLDELKPAQKTKKKTVVGRGVGSGLGKTSGRGHKGQKARRRKQWQIRIKFSAYQEMLPMRK